MQASDVMTSTPISVRTDAGVSEIAQTLIDNRISAVPVVDDRGSVVGIVSEGDLMRRPEAGTEPHRSWWLRMFEQPEEQATDYVRTHGKTAADVMSSPAFTVEPETPVSRIAEILEERRIKRVPVVDHGRLVGIVSRANLLHGISIDRERSAPSTPDDAAIRDSVLTAIGEAEKGNIPLNVVVGEGTVHIWGAVESDAEKRAIRIAAEQTPGVKDVVDHLAIVSSRLQGEGWS